MADELKIAGLDETPHTTEDILTPGTTFETPGNNDSYVGASTESISGLTAEELNDPNKITVTIVDKQVPIVVFFGSPACGKTMTLIRMSRYLRSMGYDVTPVTTFRPHYDTNYAGMCTDFDLMLNSDDAAQSTNRISFMLVMVSKGGKPICQILEGPGEFYFNPRRPKDDFPAYVNTIINSDNRKIWAIMLEPDGTNSDMGHVDRRNFVSKIHMLKQRIRSRDKVVFIYNKIDATPYVISPGQVKLGLARTSASQLYEDIFVPFSNENPITRFWQPYKFDFVAFQTGTYTRTLSNSVTFQEGPAEYPRQLWNLILKRVRG